MSRKRKQIKKIVSIKKKKVKGENK